ncbi:hypothetical protein FIV07_18540 [Mycobacterium sp. THAF192]|nr:hypothetical protein FIV07_18540 [Mycobacterium sp. THAF192]
MAGLADPAPVGTGNENSADRVTGQYPVAIHTCSRLGRVANPPGFTFPTWLRGGRRR